MKGSILEAIGKITGNDQTRAQGTAEKLAGKVQAKAASAAETVRKRTGK
ncbi:CsbD family protein [Novosphingobium sp. BK486]|nr:uncharacterized protein YjbJ (UPF0337 family) [Novosphingobium sp. BK256]MBB3374212.1 uncharacterized protein YjbJ (UPF0337 family) [Novosphingobium sp. BK280]MBB3378624.1 uncharacterized protein YjbJ (UPF0337 family) [Novosphingobium sp. BK258]MBB3420318.1 uncharacterized protein YjbJ (UPF0337 family) [Novosphingobium sp. BK267]MBB3448560.1 uncharacterized protein YjbJ (UPF0337 family) [Novosphingobium sp. BK352]MBB3477964.1 uncharacterized protein YjbJ (UPF0337 family) [Novosphingobium sp